jgi:hypothetical protein
LTTIDGKPAPFILSDDHFSAGNRIVVEQTVDSVNLESGSSLVRSQSLRVWYYAADGTLDTATAGWTSTATYSIVGPLTDRRLIIVYPELLGPPMPPETLRVSSNDVLVGHRDVGGSCAAGPPPDCPTTPHTSVFTYRHQ